MRNKRSIPKTKNLKRSRPAATIKQSHANKPPEKEMDAIPGKLMHMDGANLTATSEALTNKISSSQGNGGKMDSGTRSFMESRLGKDFSRVHIHTGNESVMMNRELNAKAFTVGNDIYFNKGEYNPQSEKGKHLLAHELAHTIQQGASVQTKKIQRAPGDPAPAPVLPDGGLSNEMLLQIARRLNDAMDRLGTDEEAIYAALSGRTPEQAEAISRVYGQQYHRTLLSHLQDELTESEMQQLGAFSSTTLTRGAAAEPAAQTPADMVAQQLNTAMDRVGTDESAIMSALTGRTEGELTAIKEAYINLTTRSLEADLRDELSGSDLTEALRLLNQGLLQPEDELYLAMEGAGTDEARIARVLTALAGNDAAITTMESNYRSKYGDLIDDLRGDLSAGEYRDAMLVLRPVLQDASFQDCPADLIPDLRTAIGTGLQKVDHAITVLEKGWANMNAAEKAIFNQFFDPTGTGDIDQRFVSQVLNNFRNIKHEYDSDLTVECETPGGMCSGNLYYTWWSNIHVCADTFRNFTGAKQKARDFTHELAHNAMQAVDRAYYSLSSPQFASPLTPRGSIAAQIPLIGPLLGLIIRSDTLYNPDSYSWFAFEVP